MNIKVKVYPEHQLMVVRLYDVIPQEEIYKEYKKYSTTVEFEKVRRVVFDLRGLAFKFDENILDNNEFISDLTKDNRNRLFVYITDKPVSTVLAHLYIEKVGGSYCSTLNEALRLLRMHVSINEFEGLINI